MANPGIYYPPALGFQNYRYFAQHYYYEKKLSNVDRNKFELCTYGNNVKNKIDNFKNKDNMFKVAGYVPLIGTVVGIIRIIRAITDNDLPRINKITHIARGCLELTSLGFFLLLPVDFILSRTPQFHAKLFPTATYKVDIDFGSDE